VSDITALDAQAVQLGTEITETEGNVKKEKAKLNAEMNSAKKTEEMETAKGEKQEESDAMLADTNFRTELTTACEGRATEWDQRSKARAAELTALAEAREILKSGVATNYGANKKLTGLSTVAAKVAKVQAPSSKKVAPSLLQLSSRSSGAAGVMDRAVQRLGELAAKLNSPMLSAMAVKADLMGPDHFVKVRGIIKDLVARLEAEKVAEASQKSFCDVEMAEVLENRDKFKLEMEEKAALIQQKTSFIAATNQEIAVLSQEIADLSKALNEASQLRQKEIYENEFDAQSMSDTKVLNWEHEIMANEAMKTSAACATKRASKIARDRFAQPAFQGGFSGDLTDDKFDKNGDSRMPTFYGGVNEDTPTGDFIVILLARKKNMEGFRVVTIESVENDIDIFTSAADNFNVITLQLMSKIARGKLAKVEVKDVFGKIEGIIGDMIAKLAAEADSEATEKAYYDEQMAKTEAKKSGLDDAIAKMTEKVDQATAKSAELKERAVMDHYSQIKDRIAVNDGGGTAPPTAAPIRVQGG
jgi:hypothetical protein